MAKLPPMKYASSITRVTQTVFGGLRHNVNCTDGELYDVVNMDTRDYPVLSTRKKRRAGWSIPEARKIYADHGIFLYVKMDGSIWYVRKDDAPVHGTLGLKLAQATNPVKVEFVRFGDRVVVMPDKLLLNVKYEILGIIQDENALPENGNFGHAYAVPTGQDQQTQNTFYDIYVYDGEAWVNNGPLMQEMEAREELQGVTVKDGTIFGEPAKANTLHFTGEGLDLTRKFKVGDAVKISGMEREKENNKTPIIREIEATEIRFSENCFKMPKDENGEALTEFQENGTIHLERLVPDMEFCFEHNNRLWGARGKEIFASKVGDPTNFEVFDGLSTDSWYLETQKPGDITGGCSYGQYPIFFRQGAICTVYGDTPPFQPYERPGPGMKEGEIRSAAMAGGYLFYLSDNGMMAYSNNYPQDLQQVFGNDYFHSAMAASDGTRIYLQMTRQTEAELYCYDGMRGLWVRENGSFHSLTQADGSVLALDYDGNVFELSGDKWNFPEEEYEPQSFIEFGDFTDGPDKKALSKLLLRLEMEEGTRLSVQMKYQGDTGWQTVRTMQGAGEKKSYYIAVVPHRTDSYRIRIEATGPWRLFGMTRERYLGSPLR